MKRVPITVVRAFHAVMCFGLVAAAGCVDPVDLADFKRISWVSSAAGGGADTGPGCGSVTTVGCCAGKGVRYCAGVAVKTRICTPPAVCGWSALYGVYGCVGWPAADPSGRNPLACPSMDAGPVVDAGSRSDVPAVPDAAPSRLETGPVDARTADAPGCSVLKYEGCCQKKTLYFCVNGHVFARACGTLSCGWDPTRSAYNCGTSSAADPSGRHPKSCAVVWGDAGPGTDLGPTDLAADRAWDAGPDGADDVGADRGKYGDGFVVAGDRAGRQEAAPDGPVAEMVVGLDATGLEGGLGDAPRIPFGEDGCSCGVGEAGYGQGLLWSGLLLGLLLGRRRRAS